MWVLMSLLWILFVDGLLDAALEATPDTSSVRSPQGGTWLGALYYWLHFRFPYSFYDSHL